MPFGAVVARSVSTCAKTCAKACTKKATAAAPVAAAIPERYRWGRPMPDPLALAALEAWDEGQKIEAAAAAKGGIQPITSTKPTKNVRRN